MTYPLEELLKEDQEFKWIDECNISFETLKRTLVEAPILRFPKISRTHRRIMPSNKSDLNTTRG